jgi:hypothetical protein
MTAATTSEREQRIIQYKAAGWNQADAEALADGQSISVPEYMRRPVAQPTAPVLESSKRNEANARTIDRDTGVELENQLRAIEEQLTHWASVKETAQQQIDSAKEKVEAAQGVLADVADRGGQSARWERRAAHDVIDTQNVRLEFAESRFKNAVAQLATWTKRKKEFPYARLKDLQKADAKRRKMGPASSRAYGLDSPSGKFSGEQGRL